MIINDLIVGVVNKLRGRDDVTSLIPDAIKKAILDLSQNYEFEELKVTGPLTNFVTNIAEYPRRGFDPLGTAGNPFIAAADIRITFISSWFVYYDTSGIVTPGVSNGMEIKQRSLRVVEPMSKIPGIPSVCCVYGSTDMGKIIVGFMPDAPYACQMRYQRQHPFPSLNSPSNLLGAQQIYMPDDWQNIIEYAAAEDLLVAPLGMMNVAMQYHQKLYGYKDKYGNETPGIITVRKSEQERMESYNERRLIPVVRRYT